MTVNGASLQLFISFLLHWLQNAHPYFSRVSFGEGAKYYAEGAYLASHHWNKVVRPYNQVTVIDLNITSCAVNSIAPEHVSNVQLLTVCSLTMWLAVRQIVIKDSDHPIPAVMYQGFEAHGVNIVLEVGILCI